MAVAGHADALVERDGELSALSAELDAARTGAGRVAVITGPPGIGKTALLEATAALATKHGLTVLRSRVTGSSRSSPSARCVSSTSRR